MLRRKFLATGATAAFGLALGGCAPRLVGGSSPRRAPLALYPVQASWDRVIRTTVGLRPNRESGFVLRADRMDAKTVIQNYGHGGSGMSLSWGTGALAADLALAHTDRRAAVIGCGIVGLTSARQLQRRGFSVTIYAKSLPPYTTSNMSWAGFTPNSGLVSNDRRTPEWDRQFRDAVQIAYREHQLLAGRGYGVSWINTFSPTSNATGGGGGGAGGAAGAAPTQEPLLPASTEVGSILLGPGEHPFQTPYARMRPTMRFEPSIYLEMLMRDVLDFGGQIVVRAFDTPADLMLLEEELIVNCTGLGARDLLGDMELTPVKGQLVVLIPQPEVDYSMGGMMPRNDGIVLGHVQQRGEWSLEVDEVEQARVLENAIEDFAGIRMPSSPPGPFRISEVSSPPAVESFFGLAS